MAEIGSIVFEAMLKTAVTENFRSKMNSMLSEDELLRMYPPSDNYTRKMKSLFVWERRRAALTKFKSVAKAAVIVVCILSTVFISLLMISTDVRAAVRDAIVQFFEGFTQIDFAEPDEIPKSAGDYTAGYIPGGYELVKSEEYGDSYFAVYEDIDGNMLMLNIIPQGTHMGDTDNRKYRTETYEGITYHIFEAHTADYYSTVAWSKDDFMFSLTGSVTIDEITKMARSIE